MQNKQLLNTVFILIIFAIFIHSCAPAKNDQESAGSEQTETASGAETEVAEETVNEEAVDLYKRITVAYDAAQGQYFLFGQERTGTEWKTTYDTIPCVVGYNGIAEPGMKREGDGKTPAGDFPLGAVFGYENDLGLDNNFIDLELYHHWISDPNSEDYNTLVDYDPAPLEAEKMKRDDHLYKYGIIVNYNTDPVVPGMGSAIFIHIYRSPEKPTAGCVGLSEGHLVKMIHWLQDASEPTIRIIHG